MKYIQEIVNRLKAMNIRVDYNMISNVSEENCVLYKINIEINEDLKLQLNLIIVNNAFALEELFIVNIVSCRTYNITKSAIYFNKLGSCFELNYTYDRISNYPGRMNLEKYGKITSYLNQKSFNPNSLKTFMFRNFV